MVRRVLTWLRSNASRLIAFGLVIGVFAFVLPRVANYGDVLDVLRTLSTYDILALSAAAILNLLTFGPPWMAALPGLSFVHSLVMSQASTAASSVLPGGDAVGLAMSYSMLRKWGFGSSQVAVAAGSTAVFNVFANVGFAVVAAILLAVTGESNPLLTTAAWVGSALLAVSIALFAVGLHDEDNARLVGGIATRVANWGLRLIRRPQVHGWDERLVIFRLEAVGLLRRRWFPLTLATLAGHLTVFLVLWVSLRAVGVPASDVNVPEIFAAWALIRILTTIPITPGGIGVVELGLTGALVSFGGQNDEVVAAVLLYRVLTFVPPIAVGSVCLLFWRRIGGAETAPPTTVSS